MKHISITITILFLSAVFVSRASAFLDHVPSEPLRGPLSRFTRGRGGKCPIVDAMESFDLKKYFGRWYETMRDKDMRGEEGDCGMARYSAPQILLDEGFTKFENSEQKPFRTDGRNKKKTRYYC